ncbi:hypothetical protein CBM2637_U50002 [Cupriavidus taiwanensis]|nr:hypothetical protein CBM2637_U50002 [Cupriavidus taiwanensis]
MVSIGVSGVGVHSKMDRAPGPSLEATVLANLPLVFAVKFQPRAIDHQMRRLASTRDGQHDVQILRAAHCRVVRRWQRWEGQATQALLEALQHAQRQREPLLESDQLLDQRIRIGERVATIGRQGFSRRPEQVPHPPRDISSGYQSLVELRPVLDTVAPPGANPPKFSRQ